MSDQNTRQLMMIRPAAFSKNKETEINNYFQVDTELKAEEVQKRVIQEFDDFVQKLREASINVHVFEDTQYPVTPDSIFPNNWVSFHQNGSVVLYPMFANNRRLERRIDLIDNLNDHFEVTKIFENLLSFESQQKFLEGTGSLVLDRVNKIAYACYSSRTKYEVILAFEKLTAYTVIRFKAYQSKEGQRLPIYHTNVMMSIGDHFVLICAEAIDDLNEREQVLESFRNRSKEIILISEGQLNDFVGNILQVKNKYNAFFLVMSTRAFQSLNAQQKAQLEKYGTLLHSDLTTIEMLGGGSARCMIAEIFLPIKKI
tara:strand:- start:1532 stop:2473 length:942 start_codon:yes stop_codon:yes gene_type:complete